MPFLPNNKHGKGRPKGSPNRHTYEIKQQLNNLLSNAINSFHIDELSLPAKLNLVVHLAKILMPKPEAPEPEAINTPNLINELMQISEADIQKIRENE